eukprot:15228395-Alexandrium_andersonii.AAC.1
MLASSLVVSEGDDEGAARPGHTVGDPLHPPATHKKVPASQRAPASLGDPSVVGSKAESMSKPIGALCQQQNVQDTVQAQRHPHVRIH